MDDETVLLVCGDHGMTDDGNHGGASQNELRSILFAYTKRGFPMKRFDFSNEIDRKVKQLDLAAIISGILDIPLPFQNLGVLYPHFFFPRGLNQEQELSLKLMNQTSSLLNYVRVYCEKAKDLWCDDQITKIELKLKVLDQSNEKVREVHQFMNK